MPQRAEPEQRLRQEHPLSSGKPLLSALSAATAGGTINHCTWRTTHRCYPAAAQNSLCSDTAKILKGNVEHEVIAGLQLPVAVAFALDSGAKVEAVTVEAQAHT